MKTKTTQGHDKRELFADIVLGLMVGSKGIVKRRLFLLSAAELDRLIQAAEWLKELAKEEIKVAIERDREMAKEIKWEWEEVE